MLVYVLLRFFLCSDWRSSLVELNFRTPFVGFVNFLRFCRKKRRISILGKVLARSLGLWISLRYSRKFISFVSENQEIWGEISEYLSLILFRSGRSIERELIYLQLLPFWNCMLRRSYLFFLFLFFFTLCLNAEKRRVK